MVKQLRYLDDIVFEYIEAKGWVTCLDLIAQQNILVNGAIKGKAICGGRIAITPVANTPTKVTVRFPQEMSSIPEVVVSPITTVPGVGITGVGAVNTTLEQTDIYVTRTNTTQTIISWIAFVA